jgi:hypothetical protein
MKRDSMLVGVLRILAFFALVVASALVLDRLITLGLRRIRTSEFGVINAVLSGRVNADIVISGSSRALVHYDPRILAEATGMAVYNIGRNGAQTDTQVAFLKAYLEHNRKPSLVVHNLDPYSFATTHEVYNPVQFLPYLDEDALYDALARIEPRAWRWKYIPLYGYAVEDMRFGWVTGLKSLLGTMPKEDHVLGYTPQERTWTDAFDRFRAANPDGVTFEIEPAGVADMEELIRLCHDAGIALLLVFSPEYSEAQGLENNRSEIFARFKDLAALHGIPFWDYSDSDLSRAQDCFYNSQHLNARGATLFSRELGARLAASRPWSASRSAPSGESGSSR